MEHELCQGCVDATIDSLETSLVRYPIDTVEDLIRALSIEFGKLHSPLGVADDVIEGEVRRVADAGT